MRRLPNRYLQNLHSRQLAKSTLGRKDECVEIVF